MGNRRDGQLLLRLPIRLSGLPPDSILKSDWVMESLTGPDGKKNVLRTDPRDWTDTTSASNGSGHTDFLVPDDLYTKFQDEPVRLEVDCSVTLLRLKEAHAIPVIGNRVAPGNLWNKPLMVPGVGQCGTAVNAAGTTVSVHCTAPDTTPSCMTLFLEIARQERGTLQ